MLFFILKGSPETILLTIRPANLVVFSTDIATGYKNMQIFPRESNRHIDSRLANTIREKCSPSSDGVRVVLQRNDKEMQFILQRKSGKDSFEDAVMCAISSVLQEEDEIQQVVAQGRQQPLPPTLQKMEKAEFVALIDDTDRLRRLVLLKAVVVGAISGIIIALAMNVVLRSARGAPIPDSLENV